MLENNMITGRDRYTEETVESHVVGKCKTCKDTIYNNEEYIKTVSDIYLCDMVCLEKYLRDDIKFIIED